MAHISKYILGKEISAILHDADKSGTLLSISSRNVRIQMECKLDVDLSDRKKEIDKLVMKCYKHLNKRDLKEEPKSNNLEDDSEESEAENSAKHVRKDDTSEDSEESEAENSAKRVKKQDTSEDSEESEAENSAKHVKKQDTSEDSEESEAENSAKRVRKDDTSEDSEVSEAENSAKRFKKQDMTEDSNSHENIVAEKLAGETKQVKLNTNEVDGQKSVSPAKKAEKRTGGIVRPKTLSPQLAAIMGQNRMTVPKVVSTMWSIIKKRNLFDPKNKQYTICDDQLMQIFGVPRFRTFGMMKYLKNHFTN